MPSTKVTATKTKATKAKPATKTSTKTKTKVMATTVPKATVAVAKAAPVSPPVPNAASDGTSVIARIQTLQTTIGELSTKLRSLTKELTSIQKEYAKDIRILSRQAAIAQKKKKSGGNGTVSGIAKPGYISPELCKFIGKDVGTEMARTEVIKHVNQYIKEHGLQDAKNKRIIRPDTKLQSLLQTKKNDEVTYFNLQTYMKRHYANPTKSATLVA